MNRSEARVRAGVAWILGASLCLSGCSLLLDWGLSGDAPGATPGGFDGGDAPSVDVGSGDASTTDAGTGGDVATDAGRDADLDARASFCGDAQLCDDFEGRSDALAPPLVGSWNDSVSLPLSSFGIASGVAASGAQSLFATVPSSTSTTAPQGALLGAKDLPFGLSRTVVATFDLKLEYDTAGYGATGAQHFADIYALGGTGPEKAETVGIYRKVDGLSLVLRTYPGSPPSSDVSVPLPGDLGTVFHHCVLGVVFSTDPAKGRAWLIVDGTPKVTAGPGRTMRTTLSTYSAGFGVTYEQQTPGATAHFDNVVVQTY